MKNNFGEIRINKVITDDPSMRQLLTVAQNVAPSRATILIMGESGTGKEVLARFIHEKSNRSKEKFLAINCAALPEGLLESELFGFEKGAFTGATQAKPGKFEMADRGTFLLDEISELSMPLQAKLLRVVQESEVERLGGTVTKKIDIRIICTSNRDLQQMVKEGKFRQDLFYRLNVIPLRTIPLRNRPKDIVSLTYHFIEKFCEANKTTLKRISPQAISKLQQYSWAGNVRELENTIQRSVVMSAGELLNAEDVLFEGEELPRGESLRGFLQAGVNLREIERLMIIQALEMTNQNRTHAADLLGISVRTLRNKIQEQRLLESNIQQGDTYESVA